ncbi:MAG: hypothetical protein VX936_08545 [Planctomycetota bacterium]|nr:hypothetical protein [Planctomycetota bacterium]MEC7598416.1 hypothetical protein [Planctomycetota bacterium]MEE3077622.1 hypothetical protein [Planctomycetota bacterium]
MNRPWNQNELDQFLRCPVTHEGLAWMDAEKLKRLNRDIESGQVMNQVGVKLAEPVDEALVNESGTRLYPCYGGLPSLLIDESILWESS